jgi:hypothetical protein
MTATRVTKILAPIMERLEKKLRMENKYQRSLLLSTMFTQAKAKSFPTS